MFCHNCGTEVADDSVFCYKCGSNLAKDTTVYHSDIKNTANGRGGFLTCIIWVCIMIGSSYILLSMFNGSGNKEIDLVRNGILESYPQKTVGEAFDGYLGDTKWESGITLDGKTFVNIIGFGQILNQPAELKIQFMVDVDEGTFEYYACEVNGEPLNELLFIGLLENVYE